MHARIRSKTAALFGAHLRTRTEWMYIIQLSTAPRNTGRLWPQENPRIFFFSQTHLNQKSPRHKRAKLCQPLLDLL